MKARKTALFSVFALLGLGLAACNPEDLVPSSQASTPESVTTSSSTPSSSSIDSSLDSSIDSSTSSSIDSSTGGEDGSSEQPVITSVLIEGPNSVLEGSTITLTATVTGDDANQVTWTSENPEVATVDENGVVTGVKAGTATIRATSVLDPSVSGTYEVTVNPLNASLHSITVDTSELVSVSVATQADEGEWVHFDISYDPNSVKLLSVTADGEECGTSGEDSYYFQMPDHDVTIKVEAEMIPDVKTVEISNYASEAVDLVGLPPVAQVGSTVTFRAVVKPGFNFYGDISASTGGGAFATPVDITEEVKDGETWYSFVVPSSSVFVSCEYTRANFELRYDSELISSVYQRRVTDEYESSLNDGVVEYDATLRVVVKKNTDTEKAESLRIVETGEVIPLTEDEYGNTMQGTFTMPARSITLEVTTTPYLRPLSLENSEHLTLSTYTKQGDTYTPADSAVFGDTVYVQVGGVSESVSIKSLTVSYHFSWNNTIDLLETGPDEDGYYSFSMPKTDEGYFTTITVEEKDMTKFQGYEFVGTWEGKEMYNWSGYDSGTGVAAGDTSHSFTIDTSGEFTYNSNPAQIVEASDETGIATGTIDESDLIFAYSDKVIFSSYKMTSLTNTDNVFAVKRQAGDDESVQYTMDYELFGNNHYGAIQFYRNSEPYAAVFVDFKQTTLTDPHYYLDVTFDFKSGTKITDNTAVYDVKVGDEVIASVGYTGEGGVNNRVILDGVQGAYTNTDTSNTSQASLTLDGAGGATLGETSYKYTINDDGTITLKKGGNIITISLSGETFTITETVDAANDYVGYTFTGTFDDGSTYYPETYTMSVTFIDDATAEMTVGSGYTTYLPNRNWPEGATTTYTIDESSGVITLHTYDSSGNAKNLTLTPNEDKTALTVGENIDYIYPSANTVLTRTE